MAGLRGQFSSRLGFILAAAGSAVGIGNLVGFPVMASKNGGAAFLLIYLFFVLLVCFPVMLAEIAMGRAAQKNPVGAFGDLAGRARFWRWVGGLAVLTPFMIAVFYTVITAWILQYLSGVLAGDLEVLAQPDAFDQRSGSGDVFVYMLGLMALVFFILAGGVRGGIEKAARVMMPLLALMLLLLVAFVLTLDNALAGLAFYLVPDFSEMSSAVVNGALNQAFFSLSLGMGILITYGSYFSRRDNIVASARMVAVADTAVAFFAGLLILPAIFAVNPGVQAEELSESSISLIFSFLPQVFLAMQASLGYAGASAVAAIFFLLVFFAALTSLVSISEIPIAWLCDEKGFSRRKALVCMGLAMIGFVVMAAMSFGLSARLTALLHYGGASKSFFELIYDLFYETVLPLIGFFVCLFARYRWQRQGLMQELAQGSPGFQGSFLQRYVSLSLGTFIPVILLAVFANNVSHLFFAYNLLGF